MLFCVEKNDNGDVPWIITPWSGPLKGDIVAVADGVEMENVEFHEGKIVGRIRAVWGLVVVNEDLYQYPDVVRGLSIGKAFRCKADRGMFFDKGVAFDELTNKVISSARSVLLMGSATFRKV